MNKNISAFLSKFSLLPIEDARSLWIARARLEHGRASKVAESLVASGLVPVGAYDGRNLLPDGRLVITVVDGVAYALTPEEHLRRREESTKRAQASPERATGKDAPVEKGEGIAKAICPQMIDGKPCGGMLNRSSVCPACENGKAGYRHRYTCESCGFDIVTRKGVKEWG